MSDFLPVTQANAEMSDRGAEDISSPMNVDEWQAMIQRAFGGPVMVEAPGDHQPVVACGGRSCDHKECQGHQVQDPPCADQPGDLETRLQHASDEMTKADEDGRLDEDGQPLRKRRRKQSVLPYARDKQWR